MAEALAASTDGAGERKDHTPATAGAPAPGWRERLRERADGGDWRSAVGHQLHWLSDILPGGHRDTPPPPGVAEALDTAGHAITVRRGRWERAKSWWSGWDAERAWHAVHSAEVALVSGSPDLAGRLPAVQEQVARELPATDRRLAALERLDATELTHADPAGFERARVVVTEAMRAAFDVADDALRRVRILRNQMVLFGSLLLAFNVLLGVLGSVHPRLLPLCMDGTACPGGTGSTPTGADVWMVQLFGVLGALIAVVVLLVKSHPGLITYELSGYQSLVKIALGATLAVVGVLGMTVGAVKPLTDNQAALLFTALVLGYAQQIATQFLDNTADRLVVKAKTGTAKPA